MIIDLSKLTDGFSSKLKVISFFLSIIKIKKLKRELYIYEKKTIECPYLFTDFCLIKNYKIFKLKIRPKNCIIFTPYNHNIELKKLKKTYNLKPTDDRKFNLLASLSYKNFIPNIKIIKKIKQIKLPKKFISIHLRTTDRALNIKNFLTSIQFPEMIFYFQINNMIKNISGYIKSKSSIKNIFICSDDKFYKEEALKKLSNDYNIFTNNTSYKIGNFRQTNGIDFITELFCLSKSQIIISTVGGAVPNCAYFISNKKIKNYKWTNNLNYYIFFKLIILLIFYIKRFKSLLINFK
jgi:hypothetical protein